MLTAFDRQDAVVQLGRLSEFDEQVDAAPRGFEASELAAAAAAAVH